MTRATTFAIVTLLFYTAAISAHATTITVADANAGNTSNVEPAINFQPECGLLESFDNVTRYYLRDGRRLTQSILMAYFGRLLIPDSQFRQQIPRQMPRGLTIQIRSAISTSTHRPN